MIGCAMHAVSTGDKLMVLFYLVVFLAIGIIVGAAAGRLDR